MQYNRDKVYLIISIVSMILAIIGVVLAILGKWEDSMLYALVAVLAASWMWLRASGMLVASNWAALITIAVVTWAMVYRGGEHHERRDD